MKNNNLICNKCGKTVNTGFNSEREDFLRVVKDWGYFSKKDLQTHEFVLCEDCYDKLIDWLTVPVSILERNEVL